VDPQYGGDTLEVFNEMEKHWGHVWGGHLTENVVQAISRDVLAEAFLRLEDQGYHTALHVHDEVVLVVSKDKANEAKAAAIRELSMVPAWAPGMPLGAEGIIADRYTK
jgi:DNA polymerase